MEKHKIVGKVIINAFQFCWPYIIMNVLIASITTAVTLSVHFINKDIINQLSYDTIQGELSVSFVELILMYAFCFLFQKTSGFLGAMGYNFYQLKVEQFFQDVFNWKSFNCNQEKFFETEFLDQYSLAQKGIKRISSHINNLIHLMFSNIATIATTAVVFWLYSPVSIAFMLVVAIVSYVLNRYIYNKEYALDKEQIHTQKEHDYYKGLLVDKANAKELRIYDTKNTFYTLWLNIREKLRLERLTFSLAKIKLNTLNALLKLLIRILSTLFLLVGAFNEYYDVGTFILLLGFVNSYCEQIDNLSRSIVAGTYKDVKYIVDYYDFVYPLTKEDFHKASNSRQKGFNLVWGNFKELSLHNISYTYPNSNVKAIDNISISLVPGEIISILGYNGSGKTTLAKILSGCLFPQQGEVFFNGVRIDEDNKSLLHPYFGFAQQEFSRFSMTIDEYINLRLSSYSDVLINEKPFVIYQQLSMSDFFDQYPDGKNTILGKAYSNKGIDLSGGEWQFLNIASSFAGEPEILLLDEPTASIDPLKEEQIMKILRNITGNHTVVLISHRLGFARLADKIILMEHGKIIEQGNHDELIESKGAYYNMFAQQKRLYE